MPRYAALLTLAVLTACGSSAPSEAQTSASTQAPITGLRPASPRPFIVTQIADLDAPWAMAFLPDGRMLITEKQGRLLLLSADGRSRSEISGVPPVDTAGQGGLMDVVLHPDFARNHLVYFSFSEAGEGGKGVVLARARLGESRLEHVRILFRATPYVEGNGHYSGRIAFSPDGFLFFTNGERQKFDPAQDPRSTLGKILRLTANGQPARGNPLAAQGFHPAIWSYGHRNLLGLALDDRGRLWEQEMGPKGGDELNLILPGRNYGYPIVSNGDHYDGHVIPDHPTRPDLEAPKVSWNPSISPAGLLFYTGDMFPAWKGSLLLGALSGKALIRVAIDGDTAREIDRFSIGTRIRDVEQGPDGAVWLLEDGGQGARGRLLKLTPTR